MLTVAKYYAASLFLVAVLFIADATAPDKVDTFRAVFPVDHWGHLNLDVLAPLLHAWMLLGGIGAFLGLACRLLFPAGIVKKRAIPVDDARPAAGR